MNAWEQMEEKWRLKEKEVDFWEQHGRVPGKEELMRMLDEDAF